MLQMQGQAQRGAVIYVRHTGDNAGIKVSAFLGRPLRGFRMEWGSTGREHSAGSQWLPSGLASLGK